MIKDGDKSMDGINAWDNIERFGAMLAYVATAFTVYNHLWRIKLNRDAPTDKRLAIMEERITKVESWQRDIDRGFTADNNERWSDNARRWDKFTEIYKDQHALNQATVSALLVILDRTLKESDDEDFKKAKQGLRAYLLDKEITQT